MKDRITTILCILLVAVCGVWAARHKKANMPMQEDKTMPCYCFKYYNKQVPLKERVEYETCDSTILRFSDKLEIFRVAKDCD